MTAERVPQRRVVTLSRRDRFYPDGCFAALVGCDVRMPAVIERGRVLAGYLVAVEEDELEIRLEFEGLAPED